jgi:hypothetical protein
MFAISCEGTFVIKLCQFIRYISVQLTSGSKIRSHVDIKVKGDVVLDMYMHVVRIRISA